MASPNFFINSELKWLENIISARIQFPNEDLRNFDISKDTSSLSSFAINKVQSIAMPTLDNYDGVYMQNVQNYSYEERLLLILSICNDISPGFLDNQLLKNGLGANTDKEAHWLKSMGLVIRNNYGYVPTLWFFIYLMSGQNFQLRLEIMQDIKNNVYEPLKLSIVNYQIAEDHEPVYGGILWVHKEKFLEMLFE